MKEKMFTKVKTGAVAANKHLCRTFGPGVALCCGTSGSKTGRPPDVIASAAKPRMERLCADSIRGS